MNELLKILLGGVGGGLIVAAVNYYFSGKLMTQRLKRESEKAWGDINRGDKYRRIMDIIDRFEDVRINYERIRHNKPTDSGFEIRNHETIALTMILKDLRVYRAILSEKYYALFMRKFEAAGNLAQVIKSEESNWSDAIVEWENIGRDILKEVEVDFHKPSITKAST